MYVCIYDICVLKGNKLSLLDRHGARALLLYSDRKGGQVQTQRSVAHMDRLW